MEHGFRKASEDIVFEEFDGDLVVLNLASGQYFGLNSSAARIWRVLMDGKVPSEPSEETISYIDRLKGLGLIRDVEGTAPVADCVVAETPVIDTYDDLSDLIMADPIHDVDNEAGWPVRPSED